MSRWQRPVPYEEHEEREVQHYPLAKGGSAGVKRPCSMMRAAAAAAAATSAVALATGVCDVAFAAAAAAKATALAAVAPQ